MVSHTKDFWESDLAETHYAGGLAGAAYAGTQPTLIGSLGANNYIFNESYQPPQVEYIQTAIKAASQDVATVITATQDYKVTPGVRKQHVIDSTMLDRAVAGTGGALPASWATVFHDMQRLRFAYGCYLQEYIFHTKGGEWPYEQLTFGAYNVVACTYTGAKKDFTIASVKNHSHFTLTVAGTPIDDLKELTLTIKKKFMADDEKNATSYYHKFPYFEEFETIEVEALFTDYPAWLLDLETEAATLRTITIAGWGKTLTLANMKLKQNGSDLTIPEKGVKRYKAIFEMGGAVAPATA